MYFNTKFVHYIKKTAYLHQRSIFMIRNTNFTVATPYMRMCYVHVFIFLYITIKCATYDAYIVVPIHAYSPQMAITIATEHNTCVWLLKS